MWKRRLAFLWRGEDVGGGEGTCSSGSKHSFLYWPFVNIFYLCGDKRKAAVGAGGRMRGRRGGSGAEGGRVGGCWGIWFAILLLFFLFCIINRNQFWGSPRPAIILDSGGVLGPALSPGDVQTL